MKKEFIWRRRLYFCTAMLVMLTFFTGNVCKVKAEGKNLRIGAQILGKTLEKDIPLNAETITQIPRYIKEGDALYVLDEAGIKVEVTGYGSAEGADVITTSKKLEKLPDNDLARIEKVVAYEGISCELLYVIYRITAWDKNDIPKEYEADCKYGGLKKYSESYAAEWVAHVHYDAYELEEEGKKSLIQYEYEKRHTASVSGQAGEGSKEEAGEQEKKPDDGRNKLMMQLFPHQSEKEQKLRGFLFPLIILALLIGAVLLFLFLTGLLSNRASLYALTSSGKYKYIGQIRIRIKDSAYSACLTERIYGRAELPSFKMKLPERLFKKIKTGTLQVDCPEEKQLMLIPGREIFFTFM